MTEISQSLQMILQACSQALAQPLTDQQHTFARHIHRQTQQALEIVADIPAGETAEREILPLLAEAIEQPLQALVGYARMLLEHPESFNGVELNSQQQHAMQTIADTGSAIYKRLQAIRKDAFAQRAQAHRQPPSFFALDTLLTAYEPIYRYWLRDRAVTLHISTETPLPAVYASQYHTAALFGHVIGTLGRELLEYGKISLHALATGDAVEVQVSCTGIRLLAEEWHALFEKDSRHLYLERMTAQHIRWTISRQTGSGATLHLFFPIQIL